MALTSGIPPVFPGLATDATRWEGGQVSVTFNSQAHISPLPPVPSWMVMLWLYTPQVVKIKSPQWAGMGGGRVRVCQENRGRPSPLWAWCSLAWAPDELHTAGCGLLGMCRLSGGVPARQVCGMTELLGEHWHDRLLWFGHCQRLHTLTGQVTVAVGTMTFEFPGLCLEFYLHNTART